MLLGLTPDSRTVWSNPGLSVAVTVTESLLVVAPAGTVSVRLVDSS